ncbi:MAG TPA: twin-arginine translocation signal domain-containing protein [Ktedonobacteraceae bacterium]|jgi:hypothetical protein|nr:twin-arginine translocation signal domain-containing protein [Ktedonobacteraceae bacterium]
MLKLTRRRFLGKTTAGAATIGTLATLPGLVTAAESPIAGDLPEIALSDTLVAHVRDLASGEISLLVGTQEIIYRDPELVGRLLRAIH